MKKSGNDCQDPANRCVPTVCGISFCILVLFWSSFMQSAFWIGWSQDESELIILWCKPMMSDSAEIIYDVLRLDIQWTICSYPTTVRRTTCLRSIAERTPTACSIRFEASVEGSVSYWSDRYTTSLIPDCMIAFTHSLSGRTEQAGYISPFLIISNHTAITLTMPGVISELDQSHMNSSWCK